MPQKVANRAQESYATFLFVLKSLSNLVLVLHDFNQTVKSMEMILPTFSCFSGQFLTFFLGQQVFNVLRRVPTFAHSLCANFATF